MVTRHNLVDHAELERRRRVDHVAEIEELARLLEADDPRHHQAGPAISRSLNIASSRPAPRSTTTLVAGSSSARVSVAARSRRRSVLRALSFSGRFNVTKPTFASVS